METVLPLSDLPMLGFFADAGFAPAQLTLRAPATMAAMDFDEEAVRQALRGTTRRA